MSEFQKLEHVGYTEDGIEILQAPPPPKPQSVEQPRREPNNAFKAGVLFAFSAALASLGA